MNWFVARIIYQIITKKETHSSQFDEQIKLVFAKNEKEAFENASLMGMEGQVAFPNSNGDIVEWKFIGIAELTKINSMENGTELCSRIVEIDHADSYIQFTQQKNLNIESKISFAKTGSLA